MNIMILAGTLVRVNNIIPVVEEINKNENVRLTIIDLDNIYFQNVTNKIIAFAKSNKITYTLVNLKTSFSRTASNYTYLKRLRPVLTDYRYCLQKIIVLNPDIIITGGDNFSERYFIDKLKHVPSYLIQDGLSFRIPKIREMIKVRYDTVRFSFFINRIKYILWITILKIALKLRISYLVKGRGGFNNCNKIFVIGKWSRDVFINEGVCRRKIIVSGTPNNNDLIKVNKWSKNNIKPLITFVTGAFKEHNLLSLHKREQIILTSLLEIGLNKYANEYDFEIKLHPNNQFNDFSKFKDLYNINIIQSDIYEVFKRSNLIVSSVSSSTLLQSIYFDCIPVIINDQLGRKVGYNWLLIEGNIYGSDIIEKYDTITGFLMDIKNLLNIDKNIIATKKQYLNDYVFHSPTKSAKVISEHILN